MSHLNNTKFKFVYVNKLLNTKLQNFRKHPNYKLAIVSI